MTDTNKTFNRGIGIAHMIELLRKSLGSKFDVECRLTDKAILLKAERFTDTEISFKIWRDGFSKKQLDQLKNGEDMEIGKEVEHDG